MSVEAALSKFDFSKSVLTEGLPNWLHDPIFNWARDLFIRASLVSMKDKKQFQYAHFDDDFHASLQIAYRETLTNNPTQFLNVIFLSKDKFIKFLDFMLSAYGGVSVLANPPDIMQDNKHVVYRFGDKLEELLSEGGSAYAVRLLEDGSYKLEDRIPEIVKKESESALGNEQKLSNAWNACYRQHPDYNLVVQDCQSVLEKILKTHYFPDEKRAQLGTFIKKIEAKDSIVELKFTGSKILDDSNLLLKLINHVAKYRGIHTEGTGQNADKEIATYILHTTIYFWNLHNRGGL